MLVTRRTLNLGLSASALGACTTLGAAVAPDPTLGEALVGTSAPGMACIVLENFQAGPERLAGVPVLGASGALAPGARWHLGSNGKAVTATLIACLVEAGILDWTTPLERLLPDLAAGMHPAYRSATLPDLLAHRAGLPENITDLSVFEAFYDDPAAPADQRLRYVSACLKEEPVGPARGEGSYSNTGPLTAAVCAERATNQSFEQLVRTRVFVPLGMTSPSFEQLGGGGEPQGHVDGRIAGERRDANPGMFAPAGAMRMSLRDWSRFCIDHMAGEHGRSRLLKAETYRFLHAPQGGGDSEGAGWALGWGAAPHPMQLKGPALTHAGTDGNWYSLVCLFPQTGAGVLVAVNAGESMGGDKAALAAMRRLAARVAPALA